MPETGAPLALESGSAHPRREQGDERHLILRVISADLRLEGWRGRGGGGGGGSPETVIEP